MPMIEKLIYNEFLRSGPFQKGSGRPQLDEPDSKPLSDPAREIGEITVETTNEKTPQRAEICLKTRKGNKCEVCNSVFKKPRGPNIQPWKRRFCGSKCLEVNARKKFQPGYVKQVEQHRFKTRCRDCRQFIAGKIFKSGNKKKKSRCEPCYLLMRASNPITANKKPPKTKPSVKKKKRGSASKEFLKELCASREDQNFYKTGRWRVLRFELIKLSRGLCEACGNGPKQGKAVHVDHIKPRYSHPELEYEPSNLQLLCEECNLGKGAWDDTDFRPEQLKKELEKIGKENEKQLL